ncbi:MAG: Crp/Fnr family transcriptional regulator [Saprospiraceae bacterium]|nr:Crp/Fnr family transcriptional regulator [Saprospiraceae bacterium]
MDYLKQEIQNLSQGNVEQVAEILAQLKPIELNKGGFLLRAGQVCKQYYFIERGSVRLYYYKGDNDFTVWIGTAGQIFTDLESYLSQTESRIYFEAIEKSTVYVISKQNSDQLALKNNAYNTLLRKTVEIAFVNLSRNVISFQSEEAAERYERVEKEKNWLSRYPLRYISSFIGVTQSSLSRLRAKKK